jgi:hypothetical protein
MKSAYKFIAGNSRITPLGVALGIGIALAFNRALGWWAAPVYVGILLVTLAAATAEPVQ